MKKILLLTAIVTSISMADFIGGELNLGYYNHSPSGIASSDGDSVDIENDLKLDTKNDIFLKVYLEHPIPLIPNMKVGYSNLSHSGNGRVTEDFIWNGKSFSVGKDIDTELDLAMYDLTLYYELVDILWMNVDLGLNVKYIDGYVDVDNERKEFDVPVPMLYAKARVDLPATDISFQVEGNYISYDNNTLYDVELGARYTFALGFGVEAGYTNLKIKVDDSEISMDTDLSGIYGKVVWDF